MKDYKLNADLVRKYVWPATGDSLEVCENEASKLVALYVKLLSNEYIFSTFQRKKLMPAREATPSSSVSLLDPSLMPGTSPPFKPLI